MPNRVPPQPGVRLISVRPSSTPATIRLRMALALIAALAALSGCSDRLRLNPLDNQSPEVVLEPARDPDKQPDGATHLVEWAGHDADGRVDHYRVAINPRTLDEDDPAWMATDARRRSVFAARRGGLGAAERVRDEGAVAGGDRDFDLIAVQAVDDRGAVSQPAVRAFFGENIAPTVRITRPIPSALFPQPVPTEVTILFNGTDPDGEGGEPAYYRWLLLTTDPSSPFPLDVAITNPDSLRRRFAPDFDGWGFAQNVWQQGGHVTLTGLTPNAQYLFVVVAFDLEGAYSPVFSLNSNMLRMRALVPENHGPRITLVSDVLSYQTAGEGLPGPETTLEYPAGQRIALGWYAAGLSGTGALEYRWVLDPKDLDKEFKRPRAGNDLHHWRPWSPDLRSATIGPYAGGETHVFVIEARDDIGFRSRLTVRVVIVDTQAERELLIVDDTRLTPDEILSGSCVRAPVGTWPTAAELDTFLFARGGVPWRCYPAGTNSSPGLFAGYRYDTLGTRTGAADPTVRLDLLSRYRHVVWIVDARSATFNRPTTDPIQPITALRYMSAPGRYNTLAAYIRGGGKVWLLGGGAGFATMISWNLMGNDGAGLTFSNSFGELVPGRFMYDFVHWRSEFKVVTAGGFINRDLGRSACWAGSPDYNRLPPQLRLRTAANSPVPPQRTPATFDKTTVDVEFLSLQNFVVEGSVCVLDSLYRFDSFHLPPTPSKRVCMTYYHGNENPPVMFSGFDIWSFARDDCQALVDFVLQDVWGLARQAPAAAVRP